MGNDDLKREEQDEDLFFHYGTLFICAFAGMTDFFKKRPVKRFGLRVLV